MTDKATQDGAWRVVPAEPTDEMVDAGVEWWHRNEVLLDDQCQGLWSAMLAAAPPVPAGSGDGWREIAEAAQFLSDRLDQLEWLDGQLDDTCRDYMGHVDPAHHRLKMALAALPTPEVPR